MFAMTLPYGIQGKNTDVFSVGVSLLNGCRYSCRFRKTPERLTTRGWNGYSEDEHRGKDIHIPEAGRAVEIMFYVMLRSVISIQIPYS
jgi:hypothetical protein